MAQNAIVNYQTFGVRPDFKVIVEKTPDFHLTDHEWQAIEAIWLQEKAVKQDALFNDKILAYRCCDHTCLHGYFIDYKLYLAMTHLPQLKARLAIYVVGISGITRSGGSILMGKRSRIVTKYAGFYECVPSGGLNSDMVKQDDIALNLAFAQELQEEACIRLEPTGNIDVKFLVFSPLEHLLEIVGVIDVDPTLCLQPLAATAEYDVLTWVKQEDLEAFFSRHRNEMLSFSQYILTSVGLNS